jgi:hypothetical protein
MFSIASRPPLGPTQPPKEWVLGTVYSRVKEPRLEADQIVGPSDPALEAALTRTFMM